MACAVLRLAFCGVMPGCNFIDRFIANVSCV